MVVLYNMTCISLSVVTFRTKRLSSRPPPQAKLDGLRDEAEKLSSEHPEEAEEIKKKFDEMEKVWNDLREALRQREDSLGEAGNLQKFLRDVDRFQVMSSFLCNRWCALNRDMSAQP